MSGGSWGSRWPFAPRCLDSQSFRPCRRIGIPVRRVAASCLQRHAQHPPPACTIAAAADVALMGFNRGGAPARFFRSLLLFFVVLICCLPTYSQLWSWSLFVRTYCLCRSWPYTLLGLLCDSLREVCRSSVSGANNRYTQHWTRLPGDVVGESQSINHHLISLGTISSHSSFGYHHGDDPHRTRRFATCRQHPT